MMYDKIKEKLKNVLEYVDDEGNKHYIGEKFFNCNATNKKRNMAIFLLSLYAILFLGLEISVMVNGGIYDFPWMTFTIVWCSIWCFITEYIGNKKGIKNGGLWGFFLSIIGVIIVGFLPNENDKKIEIVNSVTENADAIKKYKELLDMGAITEEEFERKKQELLK